MCVGARKLLFVDCGKHGNDARTLASKAPVIRIKCREVLRKAPRNLDGRPG